MKTLREQFNSETLNYVKIILALDFSTRETISKGLDALNGDVTIPFKALTLAAAIGGIFHNSITSELVSLNIRKMISIKHKSLETLMNTYREEFKITPSTELSELSLERCSCNNEIIAILKEKYPNEKFGN